MTVVGQQESLGVNFKFSGLPTSGRFTNEGSLKGPAEAGINNKVLICSKIHYFDISF
jgi:hypothetical protein